MLLHPMVLDVCFNRIKYTPFVFLRKTEMAMSSKKKSFQCSICVSSTKYCYICNKIKTESKNVAFDFSFTIWQPLLLLILDYYEIRFVWYVRARHFEHDLVRQVESKSFELEILI